MIRLFLTRGFEQHENIVALHRDLGHLCPKHILCKRYRYTLYSCMQCHMIFKSEPIVIHMMERFCTFAFAVRKTIWHNLPNARFFSISKVATQHPHHPLSPSPPQPPLRLPISPAPSPLSHYLTHISLPHLTRLSYIPLTFSQASPPLPSPLNPLFHLFSYHLNPLPFFSSFIPLSLFPILYVVGANGLPVGSRAISEGVGDRETSIGAPGCILCS